MKWFKHDTDASFSEGIDFLISKQGFEGYGRWNRLLEIIAFKMDDSDNCSVEYSKKKWCSLLELKQKKLVSFLELTENQLKTKVVHSDNFIKISIPNLLKKRDNYTKHLQVTTKKLVSKIKIKDIDIYKRKGDKKMIDPEAIRLADLLFSKIKEKKPNTKKPNMENWEKEIDLMIRKDNRKPELIEKIIVWCQGDIKIPADGNTWTGWANVIRCPEKLRSQFDKLESQYKPLQKTKPKPRPQEKMPVLTEKDHEQNKIEVKKVLDSFKKKGR